MAELEDESIHLALTSPPYWHLKDYGAPGQIGFGQSLHEYLTDLNQVWQECFRVLKPGRRLCVNVGDQFARATEYGRYKIIPLHAEIITQAEGLGFDYMGAVIWQKKTTMRPSGGATVMGSYPHPPNGLVEIDYEFILIFKKPGRNEKIDPEIKARSRLSKEDWKLFFSGHWHFGGARKIGHEAVFPEELPRRLIKMFSFVGETVLDPFLGSGTSLKAALELGRQGVGYEINRDYQALIEDKVNSLPGLPDQGRLVIVRPAGKRAAKRPRPSRYQPAIQDFKPSAGPAAKNDNQKLERVVRIAGPDRIALADGSLISFLGVRIDKEAETLNYLSRFLLGKEIFFKTEDDLDRGQKARPAYVYLKNRIFINAYLIKSGLASVDRSADFKLKKRFLKLAGQAARQQEPRRARA
ncbi:MAG: site-specific DNA-methyltransferase [Deltaproteobacteria bacterium]|nr:site-specific DNA-methyltransferase [Deltaproteobacteria bacterium]